MKRFALPLAFCAALAGCAVYPTVASGPAYSSYPDAASYPYASYPYGSSGYAYPSGVPLYGPPAVNLSIQGGGRSSDWYRSDRMRERGGSWSTRHRGNDTRAMGAGPAGMRGSHGAGPHHRPDTRSGARSGRDGGGHHHER